jgi:hypothetical protein
MRALTVALLYPAGTILLVANVTDTNRVNPKNRRVVLVRDLDDADAYAFGVAVTGTFPRKLPATSIKLPYHAAGRPGRCQTGLVKPSVADCTWVVQFTKADIITRSGWTPPVELRAILTAVQNLPPAPASSPPPASPAPPPAPPDPPGAAGS